MGEAMCRVILALLGVLVGVIVNRIVSSPAWSFRDRTVATIDTLPLDTKLKVWGQVQDEFEMWAVRFDGEDKSCGFLLKLEGIPHEFSAGDVFEIVEGVDGAREIRVCKIDQEAEFIALHL